MSLLLSLLADDKKVWVPSSAANACVLQLSRAGLALTGGLVSCGLRQVVWACVQLSGCRMNGGRSRSPEASEACMRICVIFKSISGRSKTVSDMFLQPCLK